MKEKTDIVQRTKQLHASCRFKHQATAARQENEALKTRLADALKSQRLLAQQAR